MPLKTGLVGYGLAGRVFHSPLFTAGGLELTAVASTRPQEVDAAYRGTRVVATPAELFAIDEIELVVIATPNATHAALAIEALEAGKHVIVDKPFANTVAEANKVFAAADRAGRLVCPFQNRRFDSDFATLRALVDDGALGEVHSYRAHYDRYVSDTVDRWRERPGPGAGMLYDLGVHLIDQAVCLFGRPDWVEADIQRQRPGALVDDAFAVRIGFGDTRASINSSLLVADSSERYAVHGTVGSFVKGAMDIQEEQLFAGKVPGDEGFGIEPESRWGRLTRIVDGAPATSIHPSVPGQHWQLYAGVRESIQGGAPLPVAREQVLDVLAIIEAAFAASDAKQRITPDASD